MDVQSLQIKAMDWPSFTKAYTANSEIITCSRYYKWDTQPVALFGIVSEFTVFSHVGPQCSSTSYFIWSFLTFDSSFTTESFVDKMHVWCTIF